MTVSTNSLSNLVLRLQRAVGAEAEGLSDASLLARWCELRDEAAFELLLWRHGPLVLGVCRRLLDRTEDVEDVFQATFLVLVRKAGAIRKAVSVSSWLYKVAYRLALRVRRERNVGPVTAEMAEDLAESRPDDLLWRDLRPVLDEEVQR